MLELGYTCAYIGTCNICVYKIKLENVVTEIRRQNRLDCCPVLAGSLDHRQKCGLNRRDLCGIYVGFKRLLRISLHVKSPARFFAIIVLGVKCQAKVGIDT